MISMTCTIVLLICVTQGQGSFLRRRRETIPQQSPTATPTGSASQHPQQQEPSSESAKGPSDPVRHARLVDLLLQAQQNMNTGNEPQNQVPTQQNINTGNESNNQVPTQQNINTGNEPQNQVPTQQNINTGNESNNQVPTQQNINTGNESNNQVPTQQNINTGNESNNQVPTQQNINTGNEPQNQVPTQQNINTGNESNNQVPTQQNINTGNEPQNQVPTQQNINTGNESNNQVPTQQIDYWNREQIIYLRNLLKLMLQTRLTNMFSMTPRNVNPFDRRRGGRDRTLFTPYGKVTYDGNDVSYDMEY